jgi:N-methylhydantoinase A/oxoprolinase/acetone carboxylase beta subunit
MRIGIDVGGTHTDAVLLDDRQVVASRKALTSANVSDGILSALGAVLDDAQVRASDIDAVMLGTTQFTNAMVERRELASVAAIRIALPSGAELPPMSGWPSDIAAALGGHVYMLRGGYLYDGKPLAPFDDAQADAVIEDCRRQGIEAFAISSAFAPMNPEPELRMAEKIRRVIPLARITLSHEIGRLGILERENAALFNAALLAFADRVVDSFQSALRSHGLTCAFYISQNDGTLMGADFVRRFPALTFASGPTNSLRGAAQLTGCADAIVVDIGGTTTDIGVLQRGFPRQSNQVIEVGGIRTNFRMPDIHSIGLGGGSLVTEQGRAIGPRSVGYRLLQEGRVFGGQTLTATDIVVASGAARVGDASRVAGLDARTIEQATRTISDMIDVGIERMKPNGAAMPVILVGGGSILVTRPIRGASRMLRPEHAQVANAIGAAIAQIGGEAERLVSYGNTTREQAREMLTSEATARAIHAGADPHSIQVVDVEETALGYMAETSARVKVKVVGEIAALVRK